MSEHSFLELQLRAFLEDIAAATPTPGGGSAAALSGASAAALLEMAAGVTARRKGANSEELDRLKDSACRIRRLLAEAVEEDARAYGGVEQALKLPKETDEQAQRRRTALQEALQQAARVPLATADAALEALRLTEELVPLCGKQLASDISCAVRLAFACLCGALDNVDANALPIRDDTFRQELKERRRHLEREAGSHATALLAELERVLGTWR